MELQGLGHLHLRQGNLPLQPGQSFLIEILGRDPSGKAQIRLGGQIITAMLEVQAQVGEKFIATIQKIDQSGILLVRDRNVISQNFMAGINLGNLYKTFSAEKDNSLGNLLNKVLNQINIDGKGATVVIDGKGAPVVVDGKAAPVVVDGKGAPVVADGKGAPVVADGKGAPVVADGKGAPVVVDGKGASVVLDGKGAPVVVDGKAAPLVVDGKGAPVVVDGKGAPVVVDGKGAPVVVDGKDAPVVVDGKGAPVVADGKGAPVVADSKGAPMVVEGKGSQMAGENLRIADPNIEIEERLLTGQERITAFVEQNLPQWSSLSKDGFMQLFFLLRSLGLDYERRLRNFNNLEGDEISQLQRDLGKTLKGILLSLLGETEGKSGEKGIFQSILDRLTGQQLLLQGGTGDTSFFVLELPVLEEGEIFSHTLAVKASKRGNKIDIDHCRLALHTETQALGGLGLEGWLHEGHLTLQVFSEYPQFLESLVNDSYEEIYQVFQEMNINLRPIKVNPLDEGEDFRGFIQGEFREGVDIRI